MSLNKKKVVVAMSGGVDSSVAAFLLQESGYEVTGVFMRLFDDCAESEAAARAICRKLNIGFYPVNLADRFQQGVIDYFLDSYRDGLTPNPCVRCNKLIKFGELLRVTDSLQADFLATGHYLQNKKDDGVYRLFRGADVTKDQTYFLYNLQQDQLAKILFPLGEYQKDDVRKIAIQEKLPFITKESQDVCFLNKDGKIIDHNDFLSTHIGRVPGPIKNMQGEILGEHRGLPFYTIGQRRGVEIGGIGPFYVAKCDYENNVLYVVSDANDEALFDSELLVTNVNWIGGTEPLLPFVCEVAIRYRHKAVEATVTRDKDAYKASFKEPQRAIAQGQSAVFYLGNELLGGGIIT